MKESVIIKSNAYGIIVNMDKDIPFDTLLTDIGKKFKDSAKFFKKLYKTELYYPKRVSFCTRVQKLEFQH